MQRSIAIITLHAQSSDTVALRDAALSRNYNVQIGVIGKDDIGEVLNDNTRAVFRISPRSVLFYTALLHSVPEVYKLTIKRMLEGFDKAATYRILSAHNINSPITSLCYRGQLPKSFPVVAKILHGNQGKGVELIRNSTEYYNFENTYSHQQKFVVQEFIAEASGQDKRLLIIGGRCVAAMKRRSTSADFRANLHLGGVAELYYPSQEEIKLAGRATEAHGLSYAGVDIIDSSRGPLVLEVNPSPGLSIGKITGVDVAGKIIEQTIR